MLVLGLHVGTQGSRRVVRGVLLDPADDSVQLPAIEHVPHPSHDEATQAYDARDAIASALSAHDVAAAVLIEADYHPRARVTDGTRARLRLEGACLSACRISIPHVAVMNGPDLGRRVGGSKEKAHAAARNLGVDENLVEPTAAALAAKSLL